MGSSTEWVTAYVGLALGRIAAAGPFPRARRAAERAADWLRSNRSYAAGWGYNGATGVDADSTGFALRLLRLVGAEVADADQAQLLSAWRAGGGFATYDEASAWGDAHPCVTAAAYLALDGPERRLKLRELRAYLERTQLVDGRWPAYWWRTHHYSSYHHLALLRELGWTEDFQRPPHAPGAAATSSELAWSAGIAHLVGDSDAADRRTGRLLDRQLWDGRWPGGADLRVTDPACRTPWVEPAGDLYADGFGLLTTASVLDVFARILTHPSGPGPRTAEVSP
ncbi:MAG: hypothetical protein AAFY88_26115 [Acidobacteriota bacterium]